MNDNYNVWSQCLCIKLISSTGTILTVHIIEVMGVWIFERLGKINCFTVEELKEVRPSIESF